jgi:hypothetical protein
LRLKPIDSVCHSDAFGVTLSMCSVGSIR